MSLEIGSKDFRRISHEIFGNELLYGIATVEKTTFNYKDLLVSRRTDFWKVRDNNLQGDKSIITLNIPGFPDNIPLPRIICIGTPEGNAMVEGRWKCNKDGSIGFICPRMDSGVPMQSNISELTYQQIQTPEFLELLPSDLAKGIFVNDIVRTSSVNLQTALYYLSGETVNATQQKIGHVYDNDPQNPFNRIAESSGLNAEGINAENCRVLCICDLFASGMQIVESMNAFVNELARKNGGEHHLNHLVVFAPLATFEGSVAISAVAAAHNIQTTIFTSASLLHTQAPDFYACPPFVGNETFNVYPQNSSKIRSLIYGSTADTACTWWNWSANRFAPEAARSDSQAELERLGSSNEVIEENSKLITPSYLRQNGIDPYSFVTRMTIEESLSFGSVERLKYYLSH